MHTEIKEYFLPDYLSIFRLLYIMKNIKKKRLNSTLGLGKKKTTQQHHKNMLMYRNE